MSSHDLEHIVGTVTTVGVLVGFALLVAGAWAWDQIRGGR